MRLRIATDLHDEIGSGLTQISLYSELTHQGAEGDGARWARETGELARELTGRMQDIVWAVRPEASSWQSLELRMKDWAARLLAPLDIAFDMSGEVEHGAETFDIDVRKNALMMFKEIIHNAVKHAGCSRVEVQYRASRDVLWLNLCDDGCGFDPETVRRSNGLANLRHRADELHAELRIDTRPGGPTCYQIVIPLRHAGVRKAHAQRTGRGAPERTSIEPLTHRETP
jgi:signal transduction histidine kinase